MTPEQYDAWHDTPRGHWIGEAEYRLLASLLEPKPGAAVLDVGCGTGWFTRRLAADGVAATGLDVDRESLQFARRRSGGQVPFVEGEACALPFADAAFEAVVSVTALCFVDRWQQALAEVVRVSRHRFVVGLLHRRSLLWLDKGRRGGQGAYRGAHWHTRSEVAAVLQGLPVTSVKFRYGVFLPSGSAVARGLESRLSSKLPLGSFLAVGGCVDREPAASEIGTAAQAAGRRYR